jgi:DNA-binding CsgD family transcriptional regulator
MTVATLILLLAQYVISAPLVILGYTLAGATSGFTTLIWAEGFRRRGTPSILINTILSLVVALIGFGLFSVYPSSIWHGIILCILPLFSLFGIFMTLHGKKSFLLNQEFTIDTDGIKRPVYGVREVPTFRQLRVNRIQLLSKLGLPLALLGLSFGLILHQSLATQVLGADLTWLWTGPAVFSEAAVTASLMPEQLLTSIAIGCLLAVLVIAMLLIINHDNAYERYYRCAVPVVPIALVATVFATEPQVHNIFLFLAFLLFAFIVWVELSELSHQYRISSILVFGVALTFFITAAILGEFMVSILINLTDGFVWTPVGATIITVLVIALFAVGYVLIPGFDAIRAIVVVDSDASPKPETDQSVQITDDEPAADKAERGRFLARCEQVASTYLLTTRETDLLYLLAKGRNASHIAKQLYISEGTVHTHTWHIYRKLSVHTQQELIDLVDSHGRDDSDSQKRNKN